MSTQTVYLTLIPRDPLIARDGRPFEAGLRMKSLDWFYPSVVAGSLRTLLGNLAGGFEGLAEQEYKDLTESLKQVTIAGPWPCVDGEIYFPAPKDAVFRRADNGVLEVFARRPVDLATSATRVGCNLPNGIHPALLPDDLDDFKAENSPAFWSAELTIRWLLNATGRDFFPKGGNAWPAGFLGGPAMDRRTHVRMDPGTGAGQTDDALFQTVGLDLYRFDRADGDISPRASTDSLTIRAVADGPHANRLQRLDELHPLGGERRLVLWRAGGEPKGTECPDDVRRALQSLDAASPKDAAPQKFVRMVLVTPALFRNGWRPGWLREQTTGKQTYLTGTVPGTGVVVRLVSACIDRWRPISGWSYEGGRVGPKPVRRLVPAGGVYFFSVVAGQLSDLAELWMRSVADESVLPDDAEYIGDGAQNQRDGFGLALWGVWQPRDGRSTFDT
jgi:CRISPR-associated protein Cmr3